MTPTAFPEKMNREPGLSLLAFSPTLTASLWQYIETDRTHPPRKGVWPSIQNENDLRSYLQECDVQNPNSEEFAYVILDSNQNILGTFHIHSLQWTENCAEIGYSVHHKYEGQGVVHRALVLVEGELRKMGFTKLKIESPVWNQRSANIARRSEYTLVRIAHAGKSCPGCDDCNELYEKSL